MTSHFDTMPPVSFFGGPVDGAPFEPYGIAKLPKRLRVPHRGRLYSYTLHFRKREGGVLYSYRFAGVVEGEAESIS